MDYLEEYYNNVFKTDNDPDFSEIPEDYKSIIRKTLGYSIFEFQKSIGIDPDFCILDFIFDPIINTIKDIKSLITKTWKKIVDLQ